MRVRAIPHLVIATLLACGTGTEPVHRLQLTVAVNPAVVDSGSGTAVTVAVTNPTSRSITVTSASSCHLLFEVLDTAGVHVGDPFVICLPAYADLRLDPGQAVRQDFAWEASVGPGAYSVVGTLSTVDGGRRSAPVALRVR